MAELIWLFLERKPQGVSLATNESFRGIYKPYRIIQTQRRDKRGAAEQYRGAIWESIDLVPHKQQPLITAIALQQTVMHVIEYKLL